MPKAPVHCGLGVGPHDDASAAGDHRHDVAAPHQRHSAHVAYGDRFARLHAPDLALFDVALPYVDGFELVRLVRAHPQWRTVPILMLTGETGEREINRALTAGATDYMIKPFRLAELEARIARLLPRTEPGVLRTAARR